MTLVNEEGSIRWELLLEQTNRVAEVRHQEYCKWLASDEGAKARILMSRLVDDIVETLGVLLCNYCTEEPEEGKLSSDAVYQICEDLSKVFTKHTGEEFESEDLRVSLLRDVEKKRGEGA